MSNDENKTHGGKGLKAPTAQADKNYRSNFDAIDWSKGKEDKPRMAHNGTNALELQDKK